MINDRHFTAGWKICFCEQPELIENYEVAVADETQVWHCHHRLETHNSDGERRVVDLSHKELIALGMYYNRPAEEFIFLTAKEHYKLHKAFKPLSDETKAKISEAGKLRRHSEDEKQKISEALKEIRQAYKEYKLSGGSLKWNDFQKQYRGKHWKLVDGKRIWY